MSRLAISCFFAGLIVLQTSAGCGGPPAPETPEPPGSAPTAAATATAAAEVPCDTAKACHEAGVKAAKSGDAKNAAVHFERGCGLGGADSCSALAEIPGTPPVKAFELHGRACELGSPGACHHVAEGFRDKEDALAISSYKKACEGFEKLGDAEGEKESCLRGAEYAYSNDQHASAIELAKRVCDASNHVGCGLLGVMYAKGQGTPQDVKQAKEYLGIACKAGDQEACGNDKKLDAAIAAAAAPAPSATGGLDVPNANISVGSITVDGLTMTDLACQAGGGLGALLAGPTMAGALAKKKAALKACSPKGGTARVRWTAAGGKVTKAESKAATPQIEACVVKAVTSSTPPMDGTCAATIDFSK